MEPGAVTADNPGASTTKIATAYIIWIVRIALPIVFFWIWYRTQPEKPSWYSLPHEISRSRDELMKVRKNVASSVPPKSMANLRVMDEAALPQSNDRARTASRGGAKRDNHPKRVEEASPAMVQRTSGPSSSERGKSRPGDGERRVEGKGGAVLADEEQVQLKSMLNYVTFSHKERPQRVFLPDTGQPPPPPKKRPCADVQAPAEANMLESMKGNADAQTVLKCVVNRKFDLTQSDISKSLYHQLTESRVRVSEATLSLMAESCANAGDLKGASDFLMKMEAAGHCPDSALLDKVMELFSEEKDAKTDAVAPMADEQEPEDSGTRRSDNPTTHPWSAAKALSPHPHALNFNAYSDDECEHS